VHTQIVEKRRPLSAEHGDMPERDNSLYSRRSDTALLLDHQTQVTVLFALSEEISKPQRQQVEGGREGEGTEFN
jgi:hypothetical protein